METPPRWRTVLFAAVAPPLLLGFFASALANRLVFAGWAILTAAVMIPAVRRGFEERSEIALSVAAVVCTVLAPALALFAWLVARHREVLDTGGRAVLDGLHAPAAAAPATWWTLAAVALAAAVACRWRIAAGRNRTK